MHAEKKTFKKIAVPRPVPAKASLPTPVPVPAGVPVTVELPARVPAVPAAPAVPAGSHLPELSKSFLFAGRALFTVSNEKTGEHYTYKLRAKENEWPRGSGRKQKSFFLSVKSSGGRFPYAYIGIVNPATADIKLTQKSEFRTGSKEHDVARWAITAIVAGKMIPTNYHVNHAGKCGRCGRTLTDPQSIERGIGPECWSIMGFFRPTMGF